MDDDTGFNGMLLADLEFEILSRLPPKSLMRFKCVCKHWFSVITSSYFEDAFQSRRSVFLVLPTYCGKYSLDRPFFVIDWGNKSTREHRVTVHEPPTPFASIDAQTNIANGSLCFYLTHSDRRIYIYNLTTREKLHLPDPPLRNYTGREQWFLGLNPVNKEYKLVHMFTDVSGVYVQWCEVLTIGGDDDEWRSVDICNFPAHIFETCVVYHEGFLYDTSYNDRSEIKCVVTFDVEREKFEYINYPRDEHWWEYSHVCVIRGDLHLARMEYRRDAASVAVTLCRLIDRIDCENPVWTKESIVLGFSDSSDVTCSICGLFYLERSDCDSSYIEIECYNLATGEYTLISLNNDQPEEISPWFSYSIFEPSILVESIMPLKKNKNIDKRTVPVL